MLIQVQPDIHERLDLLADASKYDLACACSSNSRDHRRRLPSGRWLYPLPAARGGPSILFKTLVTNACSRHCRYCPLRADQDVPRCALTPDEIARTFNEYDRKSHLYGLFLSSGVRGTPDRAMADLVATAEILRRKYGYRGYIHLKVIPGASEAAIEAAMRVAAAVSLNIEAPGEQHARTVCPDKDFLEDIVAGLKRISRLRAKGGAFAKVKQTTQFVVGASTETDREIVRYTEALYQRLRLSRVYFSAYQRGVGSDDLPGEHSTVPAHDLLTREHRLYQVDFLLRKYGFSGDEILFDSNGRLPLDRDPKQVWADAHPEAFPVSLNTAPRERLLRVPGIGPRTVSRIVAARRYGRLRSLREVGLKGKRLALASRYVAP